MGALRSGASSAFPGANQLMARPFSFETEYLSRIEVISDQLNSTQQSPAPPGCEPEVEGAIYVDSRELFYDTPQRRASLRGVPDGRRDVRAADGAHHKRVRRHAAGVRRVVSDFLTTKREERRRGGFIMS